jgi:hypothetical protein
MTQEQLQSINCTITDDSYVNHHNGNNEKHYVVKSPRLHEGFSVYDEPEKLDFEKIKEMEIAAYARQLFKSHKQLLEDQLMPFYRKIAEGKPALPSIIAVVLIPTK